MSHNDEILHFGSRENVLKNCVVEFGMHNPLEMDSMEFAYGLSPDKSIQYFLNCGMIKSLVRKGYAVLS
jgi:hypothetical protein